MILRSLYPQELAARLLREEACARCGYALDETATQLISCDWLYPGGTRTRDWQGLALCRGCRDRLLVWLTALRGPDALGRPRRISARPESPSPSPPEAP